jgi:M6 family metalloprotease-like protein
MNLFRISLLVLATILLFFSHTMAVDLHPDLKEKFKREGKFEEYLESMKDLRAKGVNAPSKRTLLKSITLGSGTDTLRAVVLLTEFSDNLASGNMVDYVDSAYFDTLFNSEGTLTYGSMREFYDENSRGQFVFIADVYGWYMMPQTYDYYVDEQKGFGDFPTNAQGLVYDAIYEADPDVDYSIYDRDDDEYVDALILVHAGPGFEVSGNVNHIHSHKWSLPFMFEISTDGVTLSDYNINPEENSVSFPEPIAIGVFCHEFGHTLNLPDLYDSDYTSTGVGDWSLMASGSYNGNSQNPAHFDAWCKMRLGWLVPENITTSVQDHEFPQVITSGYVARLWTNGSGGQEYFLIENRQKLGFDAHLPGEGLLIWHVDETNWSNQNEYNYLVGLEQADGLFELEENQGDGDRDDPYPGNMNVREFSETTIPSTATNDDDSTLVAVWNISDSDSLMTANLDINFTRPRFEFVDYFIAEISGDGDDIIESNETWGLNLQVVNVRADGDNVTVNTTIDDPTIVVTPAVKILGNMPSQDTADNFSSPISFTIPAEMDASIANITFVVKDLAETDSITASLKIFVGAVEILLVCHDGDIHDYQDYYTDVFDSLKVPYQVYNRDTLPTPGSEFLSSPKIIWYSSFDSLEHSDVEFLTQYLNGGGRLFLTGQNISENLATGSDSLFMKDYLKVSFNKNTLFDTKIYGVGGSQIGADEFKLYVYGPTGAYNPNSKDWLKDINPAAMPSLSYKSTPTNDNIAGIEYSGTYNLVFWGFGFECVSNLNPDIYSTRYEAMQRVLTFLDNIATNADDGPNSEVLPKRFTLNQNYPNPFNPRTVISYELNHHVSGDVSLRIYNILGREVMTIKDLPSETGRYKLEWNGRSNSGKSVTSGVYFYRLQAGTETQTRKMILLK